MPTTNLKAKAIDIGEVERGDRLFIIVEVDVDETRTKNTKDGTTETQYATVKDALRLTGALPEELTLELRRQRRAAEEKATGIAIVPGLEGFLDGSGVVVTSADDPIGDLSKIANAPKDDDEAPTIDDPVCAWLALGVEVHGLRSRFGDDPDKDNGIQVRLDGLFVELNALEGGDEVVEGDDGTVIVDIEGEVRSVIELPDFELELELELPTEAIEEQPFDGYDALDFDGIIDHIDGYLAADLALGGGKPSTKAHSYIGAIYAYEVGHGGRPKVVSALADRIKVLAENIGDALETTMGITPAELEAPWESYDTDTADTIIGRLRALAERGEVEEARELIGRVDVYEEANKKRKGVLGRTGGIVPPLLPAGPDDDLHLDDEDDLTNALDELDDNATDSELEPA